MGATRHSATTIMPSLSPITFALFLTASTFAGVSDHGDNYADSSFLADGFGFAELLDAEQKPGTSVEPKALTEEEWSTTLITLKRLFPCVKDLMNKEHASAAQGFLVDSLVRTLMQGGLKQSLLSAEDCCFHSSRIERAAAC